MPNSAFSPLLNACERSLLELLARALSLSSGTAEALGTLWLSQRRPQEELVAFLVRHQVLSEAAVVLADLMYDGSIANDGSRLLRPGAMAQLQRLLGSQARDAPVAVSDPRADTVDLPLRAEARRETPEKPASARGAPGADRLASLAPEEARKPPTAGNVLGPYLLTDKLKKGSSGIVFRALHQERNIPVAVKVLQPRSEGTDFAGYLRFKSEAQLLAKLSHPHLVRVLEFVDDSHFPYLILECVEGIGLDELIHQSGRLRWDRAAAVILQVAEGLSAAHGLGLVHRDVKPANILIGKDGAAKLSNLGLAMAFVRSSSPGIARHQHSNSPQLPADAFWAPEQVQDPSRANHQSDIYSLGATFYHAATGLVPQRSVTVRPPHAVVADFPTALSALVLKMLEKNAAARCRNCDEIIATLAQLLQLQDPDATD